MVCNTCVSYTRHGCPYFKQSMRIDTLFKVDMFKVKNFCLFCFRKYVQAMRLLVIDEIHLLGDERGPVLEVIVSRTNFIASHTEQKVRVVGLSTALANAKDLANWLAIKQVSFI